MHSYVYKWDIINAYKVQSYRHMRIKVDIIIKLGRRVEREASSSRNFDVRFTVQRTNYQQ
jgi:hypothetical protein